MGKMQRNKGSRVERQIVNILKENGIDAKRVPLSGAAEGFKGDILINGKVKCEVKARKDGFKLLYKYLSVKDSYLKLTTKNNSLIVMQLDSFIKHLQGNFMPCESLSLIKDLKQIDQWIKDSDVLFLKANRKPILAVLRKNDYLKSTQTLA